MTGSVDHRPAGLLIVAVRRLIELVNNLNGQRDLNYTAATNQILIAYGH